MVIAHNLWENPREKILKIAARFWIVEMDGWALLTPGFVICSAASTQYFAITGIFDYFGGLLRKSKTKYEESLHP